MGGGGMPGVGAAFSRDIFMGADNSPLTEGPLPLAGARGIWRLPMKLQAFVILCGLSILTRILKVFPRETTAYIEQ